MNLSKSVRIGAGLGFYGDNWEPVAASVERGQVQFMAATTWPSSRSPSCRRTGSVTPRWAMPATSCPCSCACGHSCASAACALSATPAA